MKYSNRILKLILAIVAIISIAVLYSCVRRDCGKKFSLSETSVIEFEIKDKITGKNKIRYNGVYMPLPDSIKLKNLQTGAFYQLVNGSGGPDTVHVYAKPYIRPAGITDSLVFYFGNAIPDTLVIHTGIVNGYRGDECPSGKDAGINKVTLRGDVLVETTYDFPVIVLRK